MNHPLKNPESKHYEMIAGIEAIEVLEAFFSREEMMAWAKISYMKYQLRLGHKDDVAKELKKMATFKAYVEYMVEETKKDVEAMYPWMQQPEKLKEMAEGLEEIEKKLKTSPWREPKGFKETTDESL